MEQRHQRHPNYPPWLDTPTKRFFAHIYNAIDNTVSILIYLGLILYGLGHLFHWLWTLIS